MKKKLVTHTPTGFTFKGKNIVVSPFALFLIYFGVLFISLILSRYIFSCFRHLAFQFAFEACSALIIAFLLSFILAYRYKKKYFHEK